ncbi:MAG TPA: RodZ domain-containing protein [Chloroflexota bacterium]|nr:RodZ domain-containing protein [Chloroflexota bacterium]
MSELGELLRNARHKKNLSLDEASEATRIKVHFLEALENGEYNLLPGPAYTTGFLRNYARFLGLHPDDVAEDYHAMQPSPIPTVKPATRVLASGYERQNRVRILWVLTVLAALVVGGYAIKEYNSVHAAPPALSLTPENLGGVQQPPVQQVVQHVPRTVWLQVRAVAPVWVRVTDDGKRVFQGLLRAGAGGKRFTARRSIYIATYNGSRVRITVNGRYIGPMARVPGLTADEATPTGWRQVL